MLVLEIMYWTCGVQLGRGRENRNCKKHDVRRHSEDADNNAFIFTNCHHLLQQ